MPVHLRRPLLLGYAGITYAGFLGVLAWALAFLADMHGVHSIDTGSRSSTGVAITIDLVLLTAFATHHSVMARPTAKRLITRVVPPAAERSTYVLTADLLLALVLWQWRPVPDTLWNVDWHPARIGLWVLYVSGWLIAIAATFMIDHLDLVGLRQAASSHYRPPPFQARWLYAVIRHPLMFGLLLAFWITPTMSLGHLLFAAASSAYIYLGITLEERDLQRTLGQPYADYARRTPAMVPKMRRQRCGIEVARATRM